MRKKAVFPTTKPPIAVYAICNWGGFEILEINDDRIELSINNGETCRYLGWYKLHITPTTDRMYFVYCGHRYYLEEFMRR